MWFSRVMLLVAGLVCVPAWATSCSGSWVNPVSDICWSCIFPIGVAGAVINGHQLSNHDAPPPAVCTCPAPPPITIRVGMGIAFWEPARWVEVVREPFCFPAFGGGKAGFGEANTGLNFAHGTNSSSDEEGNKAFYHTHYFSAPIMNWVDASLTSGLCWIDGDANMMFMSEIDPIWNDDSTTMIMNPEAILFNNPITVLACVIDAVTATSSNFGLDQLFWCAGAQGQAYPLNGNHATHVGAIDSSANVMQKTTMLMHRLGLEKDTSTEGAMCGAISQPVMRKNQYKYHLLHPTPRPEWAYGFGVNSYWAVGAEFPYEGEDFNYMLFRKRQCCAF